MKECLHHIDKADGKNIYSGILFQPVFLRHTHKKDPEDHKKRQHESPADQTGTFHNGGIQGIGVRQRQISVGPDRIRIAGKTAAPQSKFKLPDMPRTLIGKKEIGQPFPGVWFGKRKEKCGQCPQNEREKEIQIASARNIIHRKKCGDQNKRRPQIRFQQHQKTGQYRTGCHLQKTQRFLSAANGTQNQQQRDLCKFRRLKINPFPQFKPACHSIDLFSEKQYQHQHQNGKKIERHRQFPPQSEGQHHCQKKSHTSANQPCHLTHGKI